jgi:fructose-specific phosphotransferase system IIC component
MTNLEAIQLILLLLLACAFVTVYMATHLHLRGDAVLTGMLRGVSISPAARRTILFQEWLPLVTAIAVVDLILAVGLVLIAETVDERTAILAWLTAWLSGLSAVQVALQGAIRLTSALSILRQAEAD